MIDLILSFLGNAIWPLIAGAGGLLYIIWLKFRGRQKDQTIEQQGQAIKAHEKIAEVHKQDIKTDQETDIRIDELRKKVEDAETPEKGAWDIQEAINRYFEGKDK